MEPDFAAGNYTVLQAIYASVKSLLGPNKSLKACESDTPTESRIYGDTMQVLEALVDRTEHPLGQLLYEETLAQHRAYGNGVTTVVCMAAFWTREIRQMMAEGIPLPVIFALFEEALGLCLDAVSTIAIPLRVLQLKCRDQRKTNTQKTEANREGLSQTRSQWTTTGYVQMPYKERPVGTAASLPTVQPGGRAMGRGVQKSQVLAFSRYFRGGRSQCHVEGKGCTQPDEGETEEQRTKNNFLRFLCGRLAHGRETAMKLLVEAIELQTSHDPHPLYVDLRLVLPVCVVGVGGECSEVVPGVIVSLAPQMLSVVQSVDKPVRMMVVDGDATPSHAPLGLKRDTHVTSHDLNQLYENHNCSAWLQECATVLSTCCVGVLCVRGCVYPALLDYCLAAKMVVVSALNTRQLEALCHISHTTALSSILHCRDKHLGGHVLLEVVEGGWNKPRGRSITKTSYCRIKQAMVGASSKRVTSVVLCGRSQSSAGVLEKQFLSCLSRLQCALKDSCVLPGEGRTEMQCVRELLLRTGDLKEEKKREEEGEEKADDGETHSTKTHLCHKPCGKSHNDKIILRQTSESGKAAGGPAVQRTVPPTMAPSWIWSRLSECRRRVFRGFAEGLKQYIVAVEMNVKPGVSVHEAWTMVECRLVEERRGRGCEAVQVFDVKESKYGSWLAAYHLSRLVFLTHRVL